MTPTFESFVTPGGAVVAASMVTVLIELIKAAFPVVDARISGALMAFILTAVFYVLTAVAIGVQTSNDGLAVFAAWLLCATSAVGIKATTEHVQTAR